MARGMRFAKGQPSRRGQHGRSLPSDRSMRYVGIDYLCPSCLRRAGVNIVLAQFRISSLLPAFQSRQVYEMKGDSIIERVPMVYPDGTEGIRYKLACPKCSNTPVLRQSTIDAELANDFEPGAYAKVRKVPG